MQDILDQNVEDQTQDRSESEIHFHTLKGVRQLGANSSSFPSAAEVHLPSENAFCHNGTCPVVSEETQVFQNLYDVALNCWSCTVLPGAPQQLHACKPVV